ncbi:MAG: DUF3368 domain-containing protein [Opitutaceae bacterium]|jgi:predicted nucleic acid-binding protein|nr:DUF3368 domain-containing protein [Opitutaceae bacterium]
MLIDERAAWAVAVSLALWPCGGLGILVRAKVENRISAVVPLVRRLRDGVDFWVSDELLARIVELVGE